MIHATFRKQLWLAAILIPLILSPACKTSDANSPTPEKEAAPAASLDPLPPIADEPGFKSIFDGKSFDGWKAADMSFWSIEDGALTGTISEAHPTDRNHYLVYQGGKLGDFELKLRHRIVTPNVVNCGFQFRSEIFDGKITDDCRGYQVDNNLDTPWAVRLYEEHGRETLAWRGEKTVIDAAGNRTTTKLDGADEPARFSLQEWHEYDLICQGSHLTLKVNGRLVAEVIDDDAAQQDLAGILAMQLHSGPPMKVQFKDIRLKILK